MDSLKENQLRALLRELIEDELEECSTSAAAPGYMTPKAFRGDGKSGDKKAKENAEQAGYEIVGNLDEARYTEYRNDPTATPKQKIGRAISHINRNLTEIEKVLKMNAKLKVETGTSNDHLWKRTRASLVRMEHRLTEMAGKLREMRS